MNLKSRIWMLPISTAVLLVGCRDRIRPYLEECRRYISGLAT